MDLLQQNEPMLDAEMTDASRDHGTMGPSGALDGETLALVRLAGIIIAVGSTLTVYYFFTTYLQ